MVVKCLSIFNFMYLSAYAVVTYFIAMQFSSFSIFVGNMLADLLYVSGIYERFKLKTEKTME